MKKLLLISSLLFSFNGWAEECFQNDGDPIKLQGLLLEVTKYNTPLGTTKSYILRTEKKYCFKILGYKTPEGQEMPAYEIDNTTKYYPNYPPSDLTELEVVYEIMIGSASADKETRALFEKLSGQQIVLTFGDYFEEHTQWHLRRVIAWDIIKVELVD